MGIGDAEQILAEVGGNRRKGALGKCQILVLGSDMATPIVVEQHSRNAGLSIPIAAVEGDQASAWLQGFMGHPEEFTCLVIIQVMEHADRHDDVELPEIRKHFPGRRASKEASASSETRFTEA